MLTFAAGGLIGLFTLIFAAKAARWAKKAAIETERSANAASEALSLTERVSYSQLLPLVQIKIVPERIHSRNDIIAIDYAIDLKNLGGSEAKNVIANTEVLFGSENSIIEAWERLKVHRTLLFENDISILPGETISRPAQELKPSAEIRFSMNPGTVDPSFTVVFVASASYTFTFGERATRERTERVFKLRFKSSVDLLSASVTEASLPVERDRLFIDQISLGPILPLDSD